VSVEFREVTASTFPPGWLAAHTHVEIGVRTEPSSLISRARVIYSRLESDTRQVHEAPSTTPVFYNNVDSTNAFFMPDALTLASMNVLQERYLEQYRNLCKHASLSTGALVYLKEPVSSDQYCTFVRLAFSKVYSTFYVHSHATSFVILDPAQPIYNASSDPFEGYESFEIPNWDGYDAHAVTKETVQAARRLLGLIPRDFPDPDIAPGSDGGIGFEWVLENSSIRKLFVDIGPGATWSAYWRLASGAKGNSPRQPIDSETQKKVAAIFNQLGVIDASGRW
jgi:hypothetical protein